MLRLALVFLIIALIAGVLGLGNTEARSWDAAKILFFIFLVLAVVSAVLGSRRLDVDV